MRWMLSVPFVAAAMFVGLPGQEAQAQVETYSGTGKNDSSGTSSRLTIKRNGDELTFEISFSRMTCEPTKLSPQQTFTTYCGGPNMNRRALSGNLTSAALERAGSAGGVTYTLRKSK